MKTATTLIEEHMERVEDELFDAVVKEMLDASLPKLPFGLNHLLSGLSNSHIAHMARDAFLPVVNKHLQVQMGYIRDLAATDKPETVTAEYADDLVETNVVWVMADLDEEQEAQLRDDLLKPNVRHAKEAASWIERAGDETFESYEAMAQHLGKDHADVVVTFRKNLYFIDVMEDYREHLDAHNIFPLVPHGKINDWFVEHLITGLKKGRETILNDIDG